MKRLWRKIFPVIFFGVVACACSFFGCGGSKPILDDREFDESLLSADRRHILAEAKSWIGTPYRYRGNTRRGVDCSGLVSNVFESIGKKLPRTAQQMYSIGTFVSTQQLRPGDVVFFKNTAGKGITHVGIYTGSFRFIHSSTSRGVIESRLTEDYYQRHYAGARRLLP